MGFAMPQTKTVQKALESSQRKKTYNQRTKRKYKEVIRSVRNLVSEGKIKEAQDLLPEAARQLDRAATKNVIHSNKAARLKSRLYRLVQQEE